VDDGDNTHCLHVNAEGVRCGVRCRPGAAWCFMHDPQRREECQEARRQGGRERSKKAAVLAEDTPDLVLETPADVRLAIAALVNATVKGRLDTKIANAAGYLLGLLTRSIENDLLARRIDELESRLTRKAS
jgi:hypothetical protein